MNPEIKKQWVNALESGDYQHGRGQLRNSENEFCCLGVLCNLHAQAHSEQAAQEPYLFEYLGHSGTLPKEVRQWAGLPMTFSTCGHILTEDGDTVLLTALNDSSMSFGPVIEVIKKYL